MPRFLAILAGLTALVACESSPTGPTSVREPGLSSAGARSVQTATDDAGQAELRSLTDRLAELESTGDVTAQSAHEVDRIRALIAALIGELKPDGGGGGGGEGAPTSDPVTVSILGLRGSESFSPNPVSPSGRMVVWRNDHGFTHRIVADDGSFDTGNLVGGATSSMAQPPAGGVDYHCSIHPTMVGSISGG
jgi:plastocyanin